jgi:cold shock CspA family protein
MSRWEFLRLSSADNGFRTLEEGERVSYEPTRGRKGEQAENVRKVWTLGVPALI